MISEDIKRAIEEADWYGKLTDDEKIDVAESAVRLAELILAYEYAKDDAERAEVKRKMKTVADTISLAGKLIGLRTMNKVRGVLSGVLLDSRKVAIAIVGAL